jgi:hypothetical protein
MYRFLLLENSFISSKNSVFSKNEYFQSPREIEMDLLDFLLIKKGNLLFLPHSHTIAVLGDVSFDEIFSSTIATTLHHSLLLQPSHSFLPDPDTILEETGTINDLSTQDSTVEEVEEECSSSPPPDDISS